MDLELRYEGDVTILELRGVFETFDLPGLSKRVERLLEGGTRHLCIHVRDLTFANSTALSYLIELARRLDELEGQLVFSEPSRFFATTIHTLGLQKLFRLFPTDAEAVAYLDEPSDPEPE